MPKEKSVIFHDTPEIFLIFIALTFFRAQQSCFIIFFIDFFCIESVPGLVPQCKSECVHAEVELNQFYALLIE